MLCLGEKIEKGEGEGRSGREGQDPLPCAGRRKNRPNPILQDNLFAHFAHNFSAFYSFLFCYVC